VVAEDAVAEDVADRNMNNLPKLGVGLAFRAPVRSDIFINKRSIDFLEITSDHYLDASGQKIDELQMLSENFTLIPHSLDLSLGSADGVDDIYLDKLARLVDRVQPPWFSDHICFTKANGIKIGHLAPVPYTNEALDVFARNIGKVKRSIPVPPILENITYDLTFPSSQMTEPAFVGRLLEENDCGMLLDATNLYINSQNNSYDWREYLGHLPLERVVQIHFVGSSRHGGRLIDAHADRTEDEIWNVFEEICVRCDINGAVLERDENFPEFSELMRELDTARERMKRSCFAGMRIEKLDRAKVLPKLRHEPDGYSRIVPAAVSSRWDRQYPEAGAEA
jgi:uncharacterized protein (UPF0276 family)